MVKARGHDAVHVVDVLPGETPDAKIAELASAQALIIITKDDDFSSRHRLSGLQIVWLRIGNATNRMLAEWLGTRWPGLEQALTEGEELVEVR